MNHRPRKQLVIAVAVLMSVTGLVGAGWAGEPVLDPTPAESMPAWYVPEFIAASDLAPSFHVLDTESALGRYAGQTKLITLRDLVKMHGHLCHGLVTAACALRLGLDALYPDGVVDRTDTCVVTNNSPCFGDSAEYVTGGRIRFGTQKIDPSLGNEFVLYRVSTGAAVRVSLKAGVFPARLAEMEKRIRSGAGTPEDVTAYREASLAFARRLLGAPLAESFDVSTLPGFIWQADTYEHVGARGDVICKDVPLPDPPPVAPGAKLPMVIDFGATTCIPCKMMAPVLDELSRELAGRVVIEFSDVYTGHLKPDDYRIEVIPTQVFLDAEGKELARHEGFWSKADIMAKLIELGLFDPSALQTRPAARGDEGRAA